MEFNNFNDLFNEMQRRANDVLKNEVAEVAVETMKEHIQSDVYDVYQPTIYERTGQLLSDVQVEIVDESTIAIEDTRYEDGRDITRIIESGQGYQYNFPYNGIPRPFVENTKEELERSGKLKSAMSDGLRKRGLNMG